MAPINVTTSSEKITAAVSEDKVTATVPGASAVSATVTAGFGATGPQGPSGVVNVTAPITNAGTTAAANIGISLGEGLSVASGSLRVTPGTYATLVGGTVPSSQLPSYVDDVLEFANVASLPNTGETGKIYVAINTGRIYRWSGSAYFEISTPPANTDAVPEGSSNLYFTNARARNSFGTGATGQVVAWSGSEWTAGTVVIASVTGLQAALDGKAASSHNHDASAINAGTLAADRLPLAAANTRGAVRIGNGISIDGDGVISASSGYTLPTATDSVLGGVKIGTGVSITDGVISVSTAYAATSHTHALSSLTQSSATTGQVVAWSGSAWTAANIDGGTAGGLASLLLHFDGANGLTTFTDSSSNNYSVTRGGSATISTAQSKFGGSSLLVTGGDDCVTVPAGSNFAYGTGDFTIEAWIYRTSTSDSATVFAQTEDGTNYVLLAVDSDGTVFFIGTDSGGGDAIEGPAGNLVAVNAWHHIAVARSSGYVKVYCDGVGGTATENTTNFSDTTRVPTVGRYTHTSDIAFVGYIDELRVVKGAAIYTGNFTPPTAPYSDASVAGATILQRRGTAANLAGVTLGAGQIAYETDTGKIKVGNGATVYTSLAYVGGSSAWADITGKPATFAPSSHTHGNVSNDGLVNGNTASGQIVVTTTGGALTTAATIASSAVSGLGGAATLNVGTTAGTVAAGDHTHTQLHDRSHAITSSSDHTATAWRVFYSNASGVVTELALGSSGQALLSQGASAAPTWGAAGSTSASDLSSGTLANARLSSRARAAINTHLWSSFR
jgi:hypothetical protein